MADAFKAIEQYPDISFIDNYTIDRLETEMTQWYKDKKRELTGEDAVLASGDDRRLILQACAYYIFQGYTLVDDAGKMGLLKYSRGKYLENLGALKHTVKNDARNARVTIRFELKVPRGSATGIPAGTRVTAGDGIYFATLEYGEILPGELSANLVSLCSATGAAGNDYDIGDIKIIVDKVPFVNSAANITKPENGADPETDQAYKERVYIAPSSYPTTGTLDSYVYHCKNHNSDISDILATSPSPGVVQICYLLKDGEIPGEESIKALGSYLNRDDIRPLTDKVEVSAPTIKQCELRLTYYINQSDRDRADDIQKIVTAAADDYVLWQRSKIGRDINPDNLLQRVVTAGAKRAVITAPAYEILDSKSVAGFSGKSVNYGGLEDD